MKNIIFVFAFLLGISVNAQTCSFLQFVEDVNTKTNIKSNDYNSNIAKVEKLGFKNTTLWNLYISGYRVEKKTVKVINVIETKTVVDSVSTLLRNNFISLIIEKQELKDSLSFIKKKVEKLELVNNNLQYGDLLIASKKYKTVLCVRTKQVLLSQQFDELYEKGHLSYLKNKTWVYTPKQDVLISKKE